MSNKASLLRYYPENTIGRDFVVGDIHGSYDMVVTAMRQVAFNGDRDRLFCVGDLIDRGKESVRALRFLEQPYVFSVLGNHESMFLDIYADGIPDESVLRAMTSRNGMGWWMGITPADRMRLIGAFSKLPVVMEIATPRGSVGLLHAEVPMGMDWERFKMNVLAGEPRTIHSALWGRFRVERGDDTGVPGVGRIYAGHTPQWTGLRRLGNVYLLDTGAVFQDVGQKPEGRMTLVDALTHTGDLLQPRRHDKPVDVRTGRTPATPFGTSLVSSPV